MNGVNYGTPGGSLKKPSGGVQSVFMKGQRRRLNFVAICLSLFVPWLIFVAVSAAMSFSIRFKQPPLSWAIVGFGLAFVLMFLYLTVDTIRRKRAGDVGREPTWYIFLFITCLIAWLLGFGLGDFNYYQNMQPFFDVSNLNDYPNMDPSRVRGQQVMDAGRVTFTKGSKLDLKKSQGFKNDDIYCVAPITKGDDPLATYDFWAVGRNCCSGDKPDFHCGEFNNPRATGGLRLMRDDQRAFYRLAVQQSEAANNIKAFHPLFFSWMQDPIAEMAEFQDSGFKCFMLGMFTHFAFQLFLVTVATLAFSKMGQF